MSSSEEYLESLLQSMMNGEVAAPSTDDLKSAIAVLSGEEPEQVMTEKAVPENMNENEMEAMLAEMVANLDENEEGMDSDEITDAMTSEEEVPIDLSSLGGEDSLVDAMPDELETDDLLDGMAQEELGMDDMLPEESGMDSSMDELELDGLALEEPDIDDIVTEAAVTDDMALEESNMDDLSLDELSLDDMLMEESETGDMSLEESGMDDLSLDGLNLDDMLMEESETGDMSLEESGMDDLSLDGLDDLSLDELGVDDLSLTESDVDDLVLNESGSDDMLLDELGLDDMVLEETGTDAMSDELSLEEGMDDLAEIHDLLDQTNQSEEIDDEMLALLESVSDSADNAMEGEEDEFAFLQNHEEGSETQDGAAADADVEEEAAKGRKKKKKKKRGKKNADLQDNPAELEESAGAEAEEGEGSKKKQGIFASFLAFLTEADEEDEEASAGGEGTDENSELLAELNAEDKKAKKEKKKKEKKEKKGKKASGKEGDEEGGGKAAKKKKAKKEKKEKPVDEEAAKDAGKKLSKKKVIPVILFCATILAVILILSSIVPDYLQKRDAQIAYDMGNYDQAYDLLYGKKLNEEEEIILHKSTIILKMERKLTSYRNYQKIGDNELTALNALVQGAALYFELLPEAEQYYVMNEITEVYQEILSVLSSQYGLSETDVMYILDTGDDVLYTQLLTSIVYGISFEDEEVEEQPEALQDILPEEQEILDGMPDMATDAVTDTVTDIMDTTVDTVPLDTVPSDATVTQNNG